MTYPQKTRDLRQEITDKVVALIEQGAAPWQKPWINDGGFQMPRNGSTGRAYRGGNVLALLIAALDNGYDDPRWYSYKQALNENGQVRHGEHGTQIEFWEIKNNGEQQAKDGAGEESDRKFIYRVYTVFNAAQVDGIAPLEKPERKPFEVIEAGERILAGADVPIHHDQIVKMRAFYDRVKDEVHLPPADRFSNPEMYYGTALHELGHASGHESRLNRLTLNEAKTHGDVNYAMEELVADLASLYTAIETGIPNNPARNAAYLQTWLAALKNDKNQIFRAASEASKATDLILSYDKTRAVEEAQEQAKPALPEPEAVKALPEPVAVAEPEGKSGGHAQRVTRRRVAAQTAQAR